MPDSVGEQFRRERLRQKLTLAQVAESAGLHLSTISRIERGQLDPSLESQLVPIANALGLRVATVLRNAHLNHRR